MWADVNEHSHLCSRAATERMLEQVPSAVITLKILKVFPVAFGCYAEKLLLPFMDPVALALVLTPHGHLIVAEEAAALYI